jgi:DEAD/DEAH box helicase domain-containing protein
MDFTGYLHDLKRAAFYRDQIAHVERLPARPASFASLETPLPAELEERLRLQGIERLYSHQAEAVNAAMRGENVTIVTATASGKTLCYNLPVLSSILQDHRSRAIYLFPTKALAQDQLGKLSELAPPHAFEKTVGFGTFDGDTPADERRFVKRAAHVVLTNPDMLHVGILPYHAAWKTLFANLKFVVVDEMHTYRGVFGAHVAHVLRRLRRICSLYGSSPQFLCCSATVANPRELTARLTGVEETHLVRSDGAPAGPRTFVFWNPPFLDEARSQRRSPHIEATALFTDLVTQGVRTIVFARARKSAELILRYARTDLERRAPEMQRRVMAYRAGYTARERRQIEEGLFSGRLVGVTATNALELGVDVGGLDATILTGYPGTVASAWQQAGRAGRSGDEALSILVAFDNPLDQFLMRHPEYFFGRPHERAVVDPDNRRIVARHLLCAAYERSLSADDLRLFGPSAEPAVEELVERGELVLRRERWHACTDRYPAGDVNIRSASDAAYRIALSDDPDRIIGTVESSTAFKTLHPGAIYLHLGETFLVERLDTEERTAYVRPAEAAYYTEASESSHILILATNRRRVLGCTELCFGDVTVTTRVTGFRRKKLFSDEVLEIVSLNLPAQTFETEAFWFTVPGEALADLIAADFDLGGSIHATEHVAIGMMPLLNTCDRWDVGGVSHPEHPDTALPTIFIYDAHPGGIGIAEATYDTLDELLKAASSLIADCPCLDGCPSCVQSPKCGNNNSPLDKIGARFLIDRLMRPTISPEARNESLGKGHEA